jgi:hypothetical protein
VGEYHGVEEGDFGRAQAARHLAHASVILDLSSIGTNASIKFLNGEKRGIIP